MKNFLLLACCAVLLSTTIFAQGIETFTNIPASASAYATRNWTGDNGLPWQATLSRTDQTINGKAICTQQGAITCAAIPSGIADLSFKHQQFFGGTGGVLEVRINNILIGSANPTTTLQTATFTNINVSGSFSLEIKETTSGLRIGVDDITWTGYSGLPCTPPTAQPSALLFSSTTNTGFIGNFTAASPAANEYLVIRSTSNTLSATPVNGTTYNNDDVIGNGIVESKSSSTSFTATGLLAGTTYYYYIFSVNSACTGGPLYLITSPLTGNVSTTAPPVCAAPTTTTGTLVLTPASTSVNGSFSGATGADGYLVIRSINNTISATPVNGTSYNVGTAFGGGTVIKFGTGSTFAATGLANSTQYYFYVFAVSGFTCAGGPLYNTTVVSGNATTTASGGGEPATYYSTTTGLGCAALKTALKTIVTNGNNLQTYGDLWSQYIVSDVKPREVGTGSANVIWDIYSDNPTGLDPYNFTPGGSGALGQCGNYSGEGVCYNREHSFPQSWFTGGTSVGPGTDYHHIFPTDGKVNGTRDSYIYGEVATATFTSQNGSKLGSSSIAGFTGSVFEPINAYKGDLARAFLYMVTRYEDNIPSWGNISGSDGAQALNASTFPSVKIPYLKLMIKWHNQDPVSQKEIDRNNAAYTYQGNRNPFIDHPEYVDMVWNSSCNGLAALPVNIIYFSGKLQADKVVLTWQAENETNFDRYEIERSFNGTSYSKIGSIKATNSRNYTFNDNADAIKGKRSYYRLKKIDKDGSFTYSDVFSLHIPLNTKFTVYPNPVAGNFINLQMNNNSNDKVMVQVSDITGKIIVSQLFTPNTGLITIATNSFANGSYLVKMNINGEQFVQKIVVSK